MSNIVDVTVGTGGAKETVIRLIKPWESHTESEDKSRCIKEADDIANALFHNLPAMVWDLLLKKMNYLDRL